MIGGDPFKGHGTSQRLKHLWVLGISTAMPAWHSKNQRQMATWQCGLVFSPELVLVGLRPSLRQHRSGALSALRFSERSKRGKAIRMMRPRRGLVKNVKIVHCDPVYFYDCIVCIVL